MNKLSQKQVWNEIAADWKKFREEPRKEVKEFIELCKGNIIDIGCGSGRHFVKKKDLKFYGVDFSEKMIELARKNSIEKNLNVELSLIETEEIPYEDNFFDNAICIAVLHCIETKKKRSNFLKEIRRIMKPKGRLMIQVWSKNHKRIENKGKEAFIPWTVENKKFERYYYIYDLEEICEEIKTAGFNIIQVSEKENIEIIAEKNN